MVLYPFVLVNMQSIDKYQLIDHALMKEHVFNNAPKHWLTYIDAFILNVLTNKLIQHQIDRTFFIRYTINLFKKIHQKKYFFPSCIGVKNINYTCDISMKTFLIAEPGISVKGRLQSNELKLSSSYSITEIIGSIHFYGAFQEANLQVTFTLIFKLDKHLSMNFTFHHIHIPTTFSCDKDNVEFKNIRNLVKICGLYSKFPYIPPGRKFNMIINKTWAETYVDVYFSYSVIDIGRIFTSVELQSMLFNSPKYSLLFNITSTEITKQWIKTNHTHFLVLSPSDIPIEFNFYDGPGILSPKIKPSNWDLIITSSFQCLMVMEYKIFNFPYKTGTFFKVAMETSRLNKIFQKHFLKSKNRIIISSSSINCSTSTCNFFLLSNQSLFINVQVNNISSSFTESMLCDYGGIAVYSIKGNMYNKISSLCHAQSGNYSYQRIYSNSSEAWLGLYSYKEYGEFNVTLTVSTTKCPTITIDVCTINNTYVEANTCIIIQFKQLNNIINEENNLHSKVQFCGHGYLFVVPFSEYWTNKWFLYIKFRGKYCKVLSLCIYIPSQVPIN